ncbi:MAG: hypothetical protein NXI27_21510 [Alphaproteobacteria bacterium]|nr:hypothetical protein [Alphaproteobacteria bacterium]
MSTGLWHELIAEAALAPSVHNVQPSRWRIENEVVTLFEDLDVRLAAADPRGHDAAISLGASIEGLSLAAARRGHRLKVELSDDAQVGKLRPVLTAEIDGAVDPDPLADMVELRASWRGEFAPCTDRDSQWAGALCRQDCHVFTQTSDKKEIAGLADTASLCFMRDAAFRRELMHWMRLRQSHPRWARDGLNADAMRMSRLEAMGVPLVMGPAFPLLDRISLAETLLSEGSKTSNAAGLAIFHRPADEDPLESGRHFYRLWLRFEEAGFGAAVLAALADHPPTADRIRQMAGLATNRRVVSAFRVGRRPKNVKFARARRSLDEILLS